MSDEGLGRRTRHLCVAGSSLCWLMTNYSIVLTITCQGERALLGSERRPASQAQKNVEMFPGALHHVS